VEHDYLFRSKLNNLTEQINEITSQLELFDINQMTSESLIKLDKWRLDSYQIIDKIYEKKCQELKNSIHEIFNQQDKEINDLRLKLAKMVNVQQTTNNNLKLLTSNIKNLKQQINEIEHISIQVNINSLIIKDNLIDINISNPYQSDLSKLSSPDQIIDRTPLSSDAIASNNQCLLVHQNSNLYLIDENLFVIQEKNWTNDWIRDMCWSQILNCFFIITINNVYLVEENTLSIKSIKTIQGKFWQSCTWSDTSLYLSKDTWNSSIDEFSLKPSIKFIKHCERTESRDNKQRIDSIEYNNGTLALVINDKSKQEIFIELRSIKTFDRLWLCPFCVDYSERKMQCCLFRHDAWIVADWESSSLFHINKDGILKKIIKYQFQIHYIKLFGTNKLIISTNDSIHFHKL